MEGVEEGGPVQNEILGVQDAIDGFMRDCPDADPAAVAYVARDFMANYPL